LLYFPYREILRDKYPLLICLYQLNWYDHYKFQRFHSTYFTTPDESREIILLSGLADLWRGLQVDDEVSGEAQLRILHQKVKPGHQHLHTTAQFFKQIMYVPISSVADPDP
jgi:hypothetical protein